MKQQDFDRLKAKLGDEFEILNDSIEDNYKFFVVKKKDIWEGVEFVKSTTDVISNFSLGKIYKVRELRDSIGFLGVCFDDKGSTVNGMAHKWFKPSTESAYVNQLKKEAFERFGEIKPLDQFKEPNGSIDKVHAHALDFYYKKSGDILYYRNVILYSSGKWATKLPKRIEVEFDEINTGMVANYAFHTIEYTFNIKRTGKEYPSPLEAGQFLASQLEKYLNNEL